MNEIQRPTRPIYGRRIGDFVFQTLFPLVLMLMLTLAVGAQDCTMSWSEENYIGLNPYHSFECVTTIHPSDILTNPESCLGEKTVTLFSPGDLSTPIDVDPLIPGAQVDETYIGQRLHVEIRHLTTGEKAVAYVTIEDYGDPELKCNAVAITCLDDIRPKSEGGDVDDIIIHDCSDWTSSYVDNPEFYLCDDPLNGFMIALIKRVWTVTDIHGKSSTCEQDIFIYRMGLGTGVIEAPIDAFIECSDGPEALLPDATGYPTLQFSTGKYDLKPGNLGMCDLEVEYFDNKSPGYCEGNELIIRTWSIKDLCYAIEPGVNPLVLIQKIHIQDTKGPTIEGLSSLTLGTNNQECSANVTFPAAIVSDLCSDVSVRINTVFGDIEANGGTLYGIPLGHHEATYIAKDACHNETVRTIWIDVIDDDAPNVVCDQFTVVPLNEDGYAQVPALVFDDGSTDNCEIVSYKVSRMASDCVDEDTPFADYVEFSCCDLGTPVMVALRVEDAAGNFNVCMIEVNVQDKIAPFITCPPNKTIDCSDDYKNTALTGEAVASDNCAIERIYFEDVEDLNECGWGTVTRKWIAEDKGGFISECYQTIIITNLNPFQEGDITWPENYTTTECGAEIEPANLSFPYDKPKYTASICDNIESDYKDHAIGDQDGSACYVIHRTWTVYDLCVYDPNDEMPTGFWTHVQKIYVEDNTDPVFTKGHENTVVPVDGNCENIPYTIMAEAIDCSPNLTYYYQVDLDKDGTIEDNGIGDMVDLHFPAGKHLIKWRVIDGCGNQALAEQIIYFQDTKAPLVNLKSIFVSLMPMEGGGMIEVDAAQLNNSSSDNCTAAEDLIYSFSEDPTDNVRTFTCADLGQNVIDIYVHDSEGNFAQATTFIDIQDPDDNCPDVTASVSGLITTQTGKAVSNVEIKVEGSSMQSLMTNEDGSYNIESLPGGSFMLKPSKNVEAMNGVSTYDMVLMQRHILGLVEISDPYTMIAADVNNSGSISTSDMVAMRRLILNVNQDFGNTQSWRFVHTEHQFDPTNIWNVAFPEAYPLNNPTGNMQVDFIGIKIGDINYNASTTDLLGDDEIEGQPLDFIVQDQELSNAQSYEIAFRANQFKDVVGFQYTLAFDPTSIEITSIESGALELDPSNHSTLHLESGFVPMNWFNALPVSVEDNDILFTIKVNAIDNVKLSDVLSIGSQKTNAEAYRQSSIAVPMEIGSAGIQYILPESNVEEFELAQNAPNPFRSSTNIKIAVPYSIEGMLSIYDVTGKLVKVWQQTYDKGEHQIEVSKSDLGSEGVYYFRFAAGSFTATKKMILLE